MSTLTAPWLVVAALLAVGCTDLVGGPQQAPERLVSDWTGPDGELASRSVRDFEAITTRGPQHCELESVVFLKLGWPVGTTVAADSPEEAMREYVRDPDGLLQDYRDAAGQSSGTDRTSRGRKPDRVLAAGCPLVAGTRRR